MNCIIAVFVLFVAFRYYQQHYLVRDGWVEDVADTQKIIKLNVFHLIIIYFLEKFFQIKYLMMKKVNTSQILKY